MKSLILDLDGDIDLTDKQIDALIIKLKAQKKKARTPEIKLTKEENALLKKIEKYLNGRSFGPKSYIDEDYNTFKDYALTAINDLRCEIESREDYLNEEVEDLECGIEEAESNIQYHKEELNDLKEDMKEYPASYKECETALNNVKKLEKLFKKRIK